ncbi:MAG: large conductance mechanosensitive channel protein MscL [Actinomycetaceae bacterium]|nr:large conductance mechanosensitive channel protein MscL [Actinomycetaceae bacterium]MDY6082725.1 large conductance mechanosensitive channel protein MscL [Actinomycetaceae bacterium]
MLKGFKEFIMRGNVLDMAIGIMIGGAFTPIVTSLVENLLMPLVAAIFGTPDFSTLWMFTLNSAQFKPGVFITAVINFLIIAATIYFVIVAPVNAYRARRAASSDEPIEIDANTQLLTEIRDLMKNNRQDRQPHTGEHLR